MRISWWALPIAVCLVMAGVAGGLWLAQPRSLPPDARSVHVPRLGDKPPPTRQSATVSPAPPQPVKTVPNGAPAQGADAEALAAQPKRPADSEALAFLNAFMQARMAGDAEKVESMLAMSLPDQGGIRVSGPGAPLTAYTADLLGSGDPGVFVYTLRVVFGGPEPGGEVTSETVTLTWQDGLKVAAFDASESVVVGTGKDGGLYLHRGDHTFLVAELGSLPDSFTPKGADPGTVFGVGKDGWAVAVPSLSGSHVFWATLGLHPLLGVSEVRPDGAPVMTLLDLFFEGRPVSAAWAPGGARYVAVAVAEPSGAINLHVWDVAANTKVGPDLTARFGGPDFAVRNLRWLPGPGGALLAFDVQRSGATTGPWTFNLPGRKLAPPH